MCYYHKIDYDYQSTFALYELYFINHHYFCNIQMYTSANYCTVIISCKQVWVSKLLCDPKIPRAEKISKTSECKNSFSSLQINIPKHQFANQQGILLLSPGDPHEWKAMNTVVWEDFWVALLLSQSGVCCLHLQAFAAGINYLI